MNIQVNGETFECAERSTLYDIVIALELEGKRYAIEKNREIIPKSEHQESFLSEGDVIEVVQAIGGG